MNEDSQSEVILLAVIGLSPAILTETVWAMAHDDLPIIPDRVVVLTTRAGRERLREELFTKNTHSETVWESLLHALEQGGHSLEGKLAFGLASDSVRLCAAIDPESRTTVDLNDIRTARENEAMANFILEALRGLVETPGTEVVASIAGGRKTMGALLYAAMTLVGRENDTVTHVLVSEPYDSPALRPRFYFQEQRTQKLVGPDGREFLAKDAVVALADVPFVPLRNAFASEVGQMPESFTQMARKYRRSVRSTTVSYHLGVHRASPLLDINGERYRISAREHVLVHFLAQRLRDNEAPLERFGSAHDGLLQAGESLFQSRPSGNLDDWRHEARFPPSFVPEDIRKLVNQLRTRLRRYGPIPRGFVDLLPKKGAFGLDLDPEHVQFIE